MGARREKIEVKKAAGLCVQLNPDCGNKALYPWDHCEQHLRPGDHVARWAAGQRRSGERESGPG